MQKICKIKFLGTSSGYAIPRDDCTCLQCVSKDSKDRRLRSSILINDKILIDVGPDILSQLKPAQIANLDSVVITHEHDDHVGGLKYLLKTRRNIRIVRTKPGQHFKLLGVDFYGFKVKHSKMIVTLGLEIAEKIAYIPDSSSLDLAIKYLKEVKMAILDGSTFDRSFGGHASIQEEIAITKLFANLKKVYFTHNGHTNRTHKEMIKLVQKIGDKRYTLAYDGLELNI